MTHCDAANGAVISTGQKLPIRFSFACTIVKVSILGKPGETGSIVIDLWKDTYANYPATVADTITASAKPTIASGTKMEDSTLTGWTKAIAAGDHIIPNVDSVSTFTGATLILTVTRP